MLAAPDDFRFLYHDWHVRHRKLAARLAGADDWHVFRGTGTARPVMAGYGNAQDNFLDDPAGAYRAAALRSLDADAGLWRIWWHDLRQPGEIGAPVPGRFSDGRGVSIGSGPKLGDQLGDGLHPSGRPGRQYGQAHGVNR